MEKGGGEERAMREAGGMCDRFLTFLAKNLTMNRTKTISEGPKHDAGGHTPAVRGEEEDGEDEDDDEFAIAIERAEFDYEFSGAGAGHGDGAYSGVPTILGESAAATTTTTTRDVPDELTPGASAAAADDATVAAVEEETKVRKTVTIKEEDGHPVKESGGASETTETKTKATVERKRSSLFKKRQASSSAGDERAAPRRSGLRPRMTPALRRSSTFIEERRKSFGRGGSGKPAPEKSPEHRTAVANYLERVVNVPVAVSSFFTAVVGVGPAAVLFLATVHHGYTSRSRCN
ncbi:hypothetical protein HU200_044154 [Digitaria exilis]|uniref:Uncharacterized protein n=1 Tax=Digitaria exilis TaxID=1010633 RepID=A0A835AZJ3_9POAL|nr:hypothetical protein HU200_044154 [Digitaria exilis]